MNTTNGIIHLDQSLKNCPGGNPYLKNLTGLRSLIIENTELAEFKLTESLKYDSMTEYYDRITFKLGPSKILSYITKLTGVTYDQMCSSVRKYEYVRARKLFFVLCVKLKAFESYASLAELINKDHCSVIHALKTINADYFSRYKGFSLIVDKICEDWSIDPSVFITYIPYGDAILQWRRFKLLASN